MKIFESPTENIGNKYNCKTCDIFFTAVNKQVNGRGSQRKHILENEKT